VISSGVADDALYMEHPCCSVLPDSIATNICSPLSSAHTASSGFPLLPQKGSQALTVETKILMMQQHLQEKFVDPLNQGDLASSNKDTVAKPPFVQDTLLFDPAPATGPLLSRFCPVTPINIEDVFATGDKITGVSFIGLHEASFVCEPETLLISATQAHQCGIDMDSTSFPALLDNIIPDSTDLGS
jgi:hypothetical protein